MIKSILVLTASTVLLWVVLIVPGYLVWGEPALLHSLTALGICLVPALVTLAWATKPNLSPETRVLAILGGSGIRLFATLGLGLVLTKFLPESFPEIFWLWVGFFYLFTLLVEVVLLLGKKENSLT